MLHGYDSDVHHAMRACTRRKMGVEFPNLTRHRSYHKHTYTRPPPYDRRNTHTHRDNGPKREPLWGSHHHHPPRRPPAAARKTWHMPGDYAKCDTQNTHVTCAVHALARPTTTRRCGGVCGGSTGDMALWLTFQSIFVKLCTQISVVQTTGGAAMMQTQRHSDNNESRYGSFFLPSPKKNMVSLFFSETCKNCNHIQTQTHAQKCQRIETLKRINPAIHKLPGPASARAA